MSHHVLSIILSELNRHYLRQTSRLHVSGYVISFYLHCYSKKRLYAQDGCWLGSLSTPPHPLLIHTRTDVLGNNICTVRMSLAFQSTDNGYNHMTFDVFKEITDCQYDMLNFKLSMFITYKIFVSFCSATAAHDACTPSD